MPNESEPSRLQPGLYESLISHELRAQIARLPATLHAETSAPEHDDIPDLLARHVGGALRLALGTVKSSSGVAAQVEICNQLFAALDGLPDEPTLRAIYGLNPDLQLLHSIHARLEKPPVRPETPIGINALLTGTRLEPNLASQLRKEIQSADRVDILCAFIKWSGLRLILDDLRAFAEKPGTVLRILTTTYTGATEARALDELRQLPGTEVRVSYDTLRTRMHAKAYMFGRDTGFDTAYIGSSNMSNAALTDGLEWNVKIARGDSSHIWDKLNATFETYWNDASFQLLTEERLPELRQALQGASIGSSNRFGVFDLRPFDFQEEILQKLRAERVLQGRIRQLVVAATGTGKTMIAAFDYRSLLEDAQTKRLPRPRLLFVAHREEILIQALNSFRAVLRDNDFGELLVGNYHAQEMKHVFASIQSYNSRDLAQLSPDYFDYVVVDEFHHAPAPTYRKLLHHVRPQVLLGLTATPERSDGWNVADEFDGHISAEIRLPEAINRGLLCPFQYFGISDLIDYSKLEWKRGGYEIGQLNGLLTGNDARARLVVNEVVKKTLDPGQCRALGFCVSVEHAKFMADFFNQAGLKAVAVHGGSPKDIREDVRNALQRNDVNFVFTVDLYNEGVDIPEVDTVLFLRPTESLTVFLQQLGRGLRKSSGKECLTVLDFIGQSHRKFRFDLRLKALQSTSTTNLKTQIEQDFPYLPSGCSIVLQKQARERILDNIRSSVGAGSKGLVSAYKELADSQPRLPTLSEFIEYAQLTTDDIYRKGISLAHIASSAGYTPPITDPDADELVRGLRRMQHVDDGKWLANLRDHLKNGQSPHAAQEQTQRRWLMLWLSLWGAKGLKKSFQENDERLRRNPSLLQDLIQLLDYRLSQVREVPVSLELPFQSPLQLHASYTRDELLAALGEWTYESQPEMREGVRHLKSIATDIFLITLDKTPGHYSPTTMYEDYSINESLFHWQSQSGTRSGSETGQRYIHGGANGQTFLLFVREQKETNNLSNPYVFFGPAQYVKHVGEQPMSITWRLDFPLPPHLYRSAMRLAA